MQESSNRFSWLQIVATAALISLSLFAALVASHFVTQKKGFTPGAREELSAVTLVNGKTFFGTLTQPDESTIRLQNVFYSSTGGGNATSTDIALVKMGSEFYKPEDWMQIDRSQVLYIQALRDDSKVSKAILEYKPSTP
jgi:hypothetical protein